MTLGHKTRSKVKWVQVKIKINIIILENHGVILGNLYSCYPLACVQRQRGGYKDCKCSWVTELGQKSNECKNTKHPLQ